MIKSNTSPTQNQVRQACIDIRNRWTPAERLFRQELAALRQQQLASEILNSGQEFDEMAPVFSRVPVLEKQIA
ncbi:MAG: hypothetical protein CMJ62_13825 [Planctomycetaceae bacterium]|jgi:hypothetical protein|nr:hypothetical protein [Planctomycetaceae bacterium]